MCYAQKVIARSKVIDLLKVDFPIDEKWSVDQKHVRTPRSPVVCLVFRLIITRAGGIWGGARVMIRGRAIDATGFQCYFY